MSVLLLPFWAVVSAALSAPGEASPVAPSVGWAIAVDPFAPDTLYATTDAGLFKSTDGGLNWVATSAPKPAVRVATDPSHSGTVYTASDAGLFRSFDSGATWSAGGTGLPTASSVCCIAVDAAKNLVYVGVDAGTPSSGLYESADEAKTFRPTGLTGFPVEAIAIDPSNSDILYAVPYARPPVGVGVPRGISKSTDGGITWNPTPLALDSEIRLLPRVLVNPTNSAVVYAIGGPFLLKSNDAGASWAQSRVFGYHWLTDLVMDPTNPATLYVSADLGVFKSLDSGATWSSLPNSPQLWAWALAIGHSRLFLGVDVGLSAAGLKSPFYRSDDGGASWTAADLQPCVPGSINLCLSSGRFDARVTWTAPSVPPSFLPSQSATAVPLVANTGAFWFFSPDNLELVVKVLDGRAVNGHFWIFYGALTNVEYTITVTDTQTGAVKTYFNPQGLLASIADTGAF